MKFKSMFKLIALTFVFQYLFSFASDCLAFGIKLKDFDGVVIAIVFWYAGYRVFTKIFSILRTDSEASKKED